jgi:hypothetical protein
VYRLADQRPAHAAASIGLGYDEPADPAFRQTCRNQAQAATT